ncbi:unnamed protein product [Oikopleura dioica]|uniref:Uncharacterized protein n=1 Tax=Oikopleura dioica TaxID=34765 RepID=E4XGL5_OIKDI|nr:unnamed protein product [Oikopleura dioica]
MHMETKDQTGIPPVNLQRIGFRPLHLYLIFLLVCLLVCVHDHSPYHQSDGTILKEWHFIVKYWLRAPVSIEVRTIITRQKIHECLSHSQDY